LAVVDLFKDPRVSGSLTRSTTLKLGPDAAFANADAIEFAAKSSTLIGLTANTCLV
jgi:hypothetical protein